MRTSGEYIYVKKCATEDDAISYRSISFLKYNLVSILFTQLQLLLKISEYQE